MDPFEVRALNLFDHATEESHILLNPRMPQCEKEALVSILEKVQGMPGHIWLTTSGSSGKLKCVALSKTALISSAEAVNRHLKATPSDIWLNPLPHFHVGGLGIWVRGSLSGSLVIDYFQSQIGWDPVCFVDMAVKEKATLTALVPAQVFDLVSKNLKAPNTLRAVIVGGGVISDTLYLQALNLGWRLLPSYGLSECASQVATAKLIEDGDLATAFLENFIMPRLIILDHVTIDIDEEGFLLLSGSSLLSAYAYPDLSNKSCRIEDPKVDGWFKTEDCALLENGEIRSISRAKSFVKIGGESVDLLRLEKILEGVRLKLQMTQDMALFAAPNERLGHEIHLAIVEHPSDNLQLLLNSYHESTLPYERIRQVHMVSEIPRSPLNKPILDRLQLTIKV